jgi:2-amino-4-hydroxy-6-hydroxymethyldihydropteridine diphosphokinase
LQTPKQQVKIAMQRLQQEPAWRVTALSSLHETEPMGPINQPNYVNAVVRLTCDLPPVTLLRRLLVLEAEQGRERDGVRWGPRVIDLDLLLCGDEVSATAELQLPHPGLLQRKFVLRPMADIDAGFILPNQKTVAQQLQALGEKV